MGVFGTALLLAIGGGAWVYNRSQRSTGGLTEKSLIAGGISGGIIFIITITLLMTRL